MFDECVCTKFVSLILLIEVSHLKSTDEWIKEMFEELEELNKSIIGDEHC